MKSLTNNSEPAESLTNVVFEIPPISPLIALLHNTLKFARWLGMGQAASSELSELVHQTSDPPTLPPTGLALIALGGLGGPLNCPVVGTLETCLRERHGRRIVTWSTREIADSKGVNDSALLGQLIGNKGSNDYNVSRDVGIFIE